ncbi:MAG: CoA transferase [Dehalococcoidia bacterium]|nr:CoA transferase [Dehalococcoidia bacterium]
MPQALEGIRVLDLGIAWAGAHCTKILADMGAQVIRIESPTEPNLRGPARPAPGFGMYPKNDPGPRPWNRAGGFNERNRNKVGICLDLGTEEGQKIFHRLVAISDVLVENYSSRVVAKLGFGYKVLQPVNPSLILLSMPGIGREGPMRDNVSYGPTLEQMSGAASIEGYVDGPPQLSGALYPDPTSGILGAGAILAALERRRRTGQGAYIEMPQLETTVGLIGEVFLDYQMNARKPRRTGNTRASAAPHDAFPCLPSAGPDGAEQEGWVAISVSSDQVFQHLCAVIGRPELAADSRFSTPAARHEREEELAEIISAWTKTQPQRAAMETLQGAGVPAGALLSAPELLSDPHLTERHFFEISHHPEAGSFPVPGVQFKLSATPGSVRTPAPTLGQHNGWVLSELLGFSSAEIASLNARRIVTTIPTDAVTEPGAPKG